MKRKNNKIDNNNIDNKDNENNKDNKIQGKIQDKRQDKKHNKTKLFVLVSAFFLLSLFLFSSFVLAIENETKKVEKAYSWLRKNAVWKNLNVEEAVFSFLALKNTLTLNQQKMFYDALREKSQNFTCWPKENCNVKTTAIAKLAVDRIAINESKKVKEWLLNKKKVVTDTNILLYISPSFSGSVVCTETNHNINIVFDNGIKVNENSETSCLFVENNTLRVNSSCMNDVFSFMCNDSISFFPFFKIKDEFYVISDAIEIPGFSFTNFTLPKIFCIAENAESAESEDCNYEASLWTAYVLASLENESKNFLVYLISEADNNIKYFSYGFLYYLTNISEFFEKANRFRDYSLGMVYSISEAKAMPYSSSYSLTALASLFGIVENKTEIKATLLKQQANDSSWNSSVLDTALVLFGFWPTTLSYCEIMGKTCVLDCRGIGGTLLGFTCGQGTCCDLSNVTNSCELLNGKCNVSCSNESVAVNLNCETGKCCKNFSEVTCAEIGGNICDIGQKCVSSSSTISFLNVKDTAHCCIGNCTTLTKNCTELGGEICKTSEGKSCPAEKQLISSDNAICCQKGSCISQLLKCSEMGGKKCRADEECKDGLFEIASDTAGIASCCVSGGVCIASTCEHETCEEGEKCNGRVYETADALKCCDGQCIKEASCISLNGTVCPEDMKCDDDAFVEASDTTRCCTTTCKKPSKKPLLIIILIFVALCIAGGIFYLFKTGKIKIKKEEKAKIVPKTMPSMQPFGIKQQPGLGFPK